jgi:Restriction alleviation protein Lar
MTDTILSCPFCGGPGVVEEVEEKSSLSGIRFSVGCNSSTEADCMGYQSLTTFARRSEAVEAWNKRAAVETSVSVDGLERMIYSHMASSEPSNIKTRCKGAAKALYDYLFPSRG